jgi:hypothetical protein
MVRQSSVLDNGTCQQFQWQVLNKIDIVSPLVTAVFALLFVAPGIKAKRVIDWFIKMLSFVHGS